MQKDQLLDKTTLLGLTRYQKALLQAVLRNSRDKTAPSLSDAMSNGICVQAQSIELGTKEIVLNAFSLMPDTKTSIIFEPNSSSQNRDVLITQLADYCLITDLNLVRGNWVVTEGKFKGVNVDLTDPGPGRRNIAFSDALSYILKTRFKPISGYDSLEIKRRGLTLKAGDLIHLLLMEMHISGPDYCTGYAVISDLLINIIDGTYFKGEGINVDLTNEKSLVNEHEEVSAPSIDDDLER